MHLKFYFSFLTKVIIQHTIRNIMPILHKNINHIDFEFEKKSKRSFFLFLGNFSNQVFRRSDPDPVYSKIGSGIDCFLEGRTRIRVKPNRIRTLLSSHLVDVGGDLEDRVRGSYQLVEPVSTLALRAQAHLSRLYVQEVMTHFIQ